VSELEGESEIDVGGEREKGWSRCKIGFQWVFFLMKLTKFNIERKNCKKNILSEHSGEEEGYKFQITKPKNI
jgi:hypothetical protein